MELDRPDGTHATASVLIAGLMFGLLLSALGGLPSARGATVSYHLYGTEMGWGFSSTTITFPGPRLYANVGDTVDLTLTGVDGSRHNWLLDYNGNQRRDAGEPLSADFTGNTTVYRFVADRAGVYGYLCEYHPDMMVGTMQINATGNAPPTATLSSPNGGLSWTGGSLHRIWWNMSDPQDLNTALRVFLNYSYNAGANRGAIAGSLAGTPNPNWHAWTVPPIDATDVRVNLTVVDTAGARGYDEKPVPVVDSTRPTVTATQPASGATGVPSGTWLNVTFSEAMNRPATEGAVELRQASTWALVATTVVGWTGSMLTVRPLSPLATDTAYQINISVGAKDTSDPGNALALPFSARFTTVNLPPSIGIDRPAGGERWTGSAPQSIAWRASDPETPGGGLSVSLSYSLTGTAPWTLIAAGLSGNAGVTPWTPPPANSATVAINGTVSDGRGRTATSISPAFAIDSTPPTVIGAAPTGTGVVTNTNVLVTFSEPMNRTATAAPATFGLRDAATLAWVPGTFRWDPGGAVMTFDPTPLLSPGTTYAAFLNTSAKDASDPGNAMSAPVTWTFTTGAGADSEPPRFLAAQAVPDPQEAGLAVNVTARVVDNTGVATVSLYVAAPDGSPSNATMAAAGGDVWYLERPYNVVGVHTFRVWAVDASGNWNSTAGQFRIQDTTPPSIEGLTAVPDPAEVPATVNVSALARDNVGVAGLWFDVAGVGNFTATVDSSSGRHFAVVSVRQIGGFTVTAWARDLSGLWARAPGQFTVRDTTPPAISAVRVVPGVPEVNATARLEADVSDNYGVASVSIVIGGVGNLSMTYDVAAGAYIASRAFAPIGPYGYTVWAVDLAGVPGSRSGAFSVGDSTPPVISHTPPAPGEPMRPLHVEARITDNDWVAGATVRYRGVLGDAHQEVLSRATGGAFLVELPPQMCAGVLRYDFTAMDKAGNTAASAEFTIRIQGATAVACLYGDTTQGWGHEPDGLSVPGPTLTHVVGDNVTVVVIGVDTAPHFFFVDYNDNGVEDPGESRSSDVRGNATVFTFTADRPGVFTYYCGYHTATMRGTFVVRGPEVVGGGAVDLLAEEVAVGILVLAAVAIAVAAIVIRRRRKKPPEASEEASLPPP